MFKVFDRVLQRNQQATSEQVERVITQVGRLTGPVWSDPHINCARLGLAHTVGYYRKGKTVVNVYQRREELESDLTDPEIHQNWEAMVYGSRRQKVGQLRLLATLDPKEKLHRNPLGRPPEAIE
jgi:hypothetical protein